MSQEEVIRCDYCKKIRGCLKKDINFTHPFGSSTAEITITVVTGGADICDSCILRHVRDAYKSVRVDLDPKPKPKESGTKKPAKPKGAGTASGAADKPKP